MIGVGGGMADKAGDNEGGELNEERMRWDDLEVSASMIVERSPEVGGSVESACNTGGATPRSGINWAIIRENDDNYLRIQSYHYRHEIDSRSEVD